MESVLIELYCIKISTKTKIKDITLQSVNVTHHAIQSNKNGPVKAGSGQNDIQGIEISCSGFWTRSRFLEQVLMEHKSIKDSLECKLQIDYTPSTRIHSRNGDTVERWLQLNLNPFVNPQKIILRNKNETKKAHFPSAKQFVQY